VLTAGRRLRTLLEAPEVILQPAVATPFNALLAQELGCPAIALGGYALGASEGLSEPLITVGDLERAALAITRVVTIPLMVDAGAGFGENVHVRGAIRRLEHAGVAAIHIEDQVYPKRVHYHRGIEQIVSSDVMVRRIQTACAARSDPDLVIVARTDAMSTDSYDEAIKRAREYRGAGADMIMLFPNTEEEASRVPKDLPGVPLIYVNSSGNRLGRGIFGLAQLAAWGWKMDYESTLVTNVAANAVQVALRSLRETGLARENHEDMVRSRKMVEDVIGLNTLYQIEADEVGIGGGT